MENSAPASPTFYDAVTRPQELARMDGATLFAINIRNAGWAVEFYEAARDPEDTVGKGVWTKRGRPGLVTYAYYPTLQGAIEGEIARLEARQAARVEAGRGG